MDRWFEILEDIDWDGSVEIGNETRTVAQFIIDNWSRIHGQFMKDPVIDWIFESDASGRRNWQLGGFCYRPGRRNDVSEIRINRGQIPAYLESERIHCWEAHACYWNLVGSGKNNTVVHLKTDNAGAMFAVTRGSRSQVMHSECVTLAMHCIESAIYVARVSYINTHHNVVADYLSRMAYSSWNAASFSAVALKKVCAELRTEPVFDAMADPINRIRTPSSGALMPFCGWLPWVGMDRQDFFCQSFADVRGPIWVFPPPSLVQSVCVHVVRHVRATVWVVAPLHPCARWLRILKSSGVIRHNLIVPNTAIDGPGTDSYREWRLIVWSSI